MDDRNTNVRALRRLRKRKDHLEREIYDTETNIHMSRQTPGDGGDRNLEYVWTLENQDRQEEIDELDYVFAHIADAERSEHVDWSRRAYMLLAIVAIIISCLAMYGVVRAL